MRRALFLAASLLSACSAIVGTPLDPGAPLRCEVYDDGFDPCPERSSCVDGFCTVTYDVCNGLDDNGNGVTDEGSPIAPPCDGGARCVRGACMTGCSTEVCNGVDDDCDGVVDQGLDVDADMDRVSACPAEGEPDCDDANSGVHPANPALGVSAATEICNGLDDDCNPSTSEDVIGICGAGSVCQRLPGAISPTCIALTDCRLAPCTPPAVCDTMTRACSMPPSDCRMVGMGCPSPLVCNAASGMCETPPLGAIGAPCQDDAECASALCVPRGALRLAAGPSPGICGAACCSNSDCGAGERCWAPGTGARSCVNAEIYGDATAELCSLPSDCASSCQDGSVTYTVGGTERSFDGMICGGEVLLGSDAYCPDTIFGRIPCNNGLCLTDSETCANPCERTADCLPQYPEFFAASDYDPVCGYLTTGTSIFTACLPPVSTGTRTTGTTCSSNAECRDAFCVSGRCADVCCSDRNCPGDFRCAPIPAMIGTREVWPMRCFPRAGGPG
jgi:Putative metal-binding motif